MNIFKVEDIARYVGLSAIIKGISISPLKLQKLLYYVQAWHMVFHGKNETLFDERPQAWVNGPVYPTVYRLYKDKVPNMCDHLKPSDFCTGNPEDALRDLTAKLNLDEGRVELLDSIILLYGSKSQNQLIFLTHSELPWAEQREGLAPYERSDRELSLETMYNYYSERRNRNLKKHEIDRSRH